MIATGSGRLAAAYRLLASLVVVAVVAGCSSGPGTPPSTGQSSDGAAASEPAPQLGHLDVVAKIPVPDAFDIVDAFGSIWVAANNSGAIVRIDPASNTIVATIHVSTFVASLAPTADGIWTIDGDARAVRRIDPKTNRLSSDSIAIGDDGGSLQSAGGVLWQSGKGTARRIDPRTGSVVPFRLGSCDDCGLSVLGADGYAIGTGGLSRIDLGSHDVLATNTGDVAGQLIGITPGGIWTGSPDGGAVLLDATSLTVRQRFTAAPATAAGSSWSLGIAGANGGIVPDDAGAWLRFSAPVLGHVVTRTGQVLLYGTLPPSPFVASGFVVADGSLWVTNTGGAPGSDETGSVWRLALPAS